MTRAGRPLTHSEPLRTRSVRATNTQWEKFQALGGAKWLRAQINRAPAPSPSRLRKS